MLNKILHWLLMHRRPRTHSLMPPSAAQASARGGADAFGSASEVDAGHSPCAQGAFAASGPAPLAAAAADIEGETNDPPRRDDDVIARTLRIFGAVEHDSGVGLRVEGLIVGNVVARNLDADRCLTIGADAMVVGDVWAHRVRVDGAIEGTLTAEECEIAGQVSGSVHSVAPPRLLGGAARVHGETQRLTQICFPERHQLVEQAAHARSERLVNQIGAMEALQTLSNVRLVERRVVAREHTPHGTERPSVASARPAGRLQAQIREIERNLLADGSNATLAAGGASGAPPIHGRRDGR